MKSAPVGVHAATAQYGTWLSYGGTARVVLAIVLLTAAAGVAYAATRLPLPVGPARPTATARKALVVTWLLSLAVLLVCVTVYVKHVLDEHLFHAAPPADPITPVTVMGVCVVGLIIFAAGSSYGTRTALVSGAIGAMAAPMIFEFPFDLVVMTRTYPPVPPDPAMYRVLFFAPLLLVEVTTLALLPLSAMVRLSRATLFCFALMLGVFAVWALSGFGYPSGPVPFTMNVVSKILAFAATLSLFLPRRAPVSAPGQAPSPAVPIMQAPPRA
jgi:hypothetical protein